MSASGAGVRPWSISDGSVVHSSTLRAQSEWEERGGAAAEENRRHRSAIGDLTPELELGDQRVVVRLHQLFEAGVGVEVAVGAFERAEGDVQVDGERFAVHEKMLAGLCD